MRDIMLIDTVSLNSCYVICEVFHHLILKQKEMCGMIFLLLLLSFFLSLSPLSSSYLFSADTKRKVEQISEELRSLDEMLAGNEGADGAVEVTADEMPPAPSGDPTQPDRKGLDFYIGEGNDHQSIVEICHGTK